MTAAIAQILDMDNRGGELETSIIPCGQGYSQFTNFPRVQLFRTQDNQCVCCVNLGKSLVVEASNHHDPIMDLPCSKRDPIPLANPFWRRIGAQASSDCHFKDVMGNASNLAVYPFANSIPSFLGRLP